MAENTVFDAAAMPPERFEVLIRELLIRMGFDENTVKVTPTAAKAAST